MPEDILHLHQLGTLQGLGKAARAAGLLLPLSWARTHSECAFYSRAFQTVSPKVFLGILLQTHHVMTEIPQGLGCS